MALPGIKERIDNCVIRINAKVACEKKVSSGRILWNVLAPERVDDNEKVREKVHGDLAYPTLRLKELNDLEWAKKKQEKK